MPWWKERRERNEDQKISPNKKLKENDCYIFLINTHINTIQTTCNTLLIIINNNHYYKSDRSTASTVSLIKF